MNKAKRHKKILFIANHRIGRAPNQRFRFEQYLDVFTANGFNWDISYLISEKDDKVFYKSGHLLVKALIIFKALLIRVRDVFRANRYDVIYISREAHMLGTSIFEYLFHKSRAKVIYDFDDAIWLQDVSEGNKKLAFLKRPGKTAEQIKFAGLVFAGNKYLADYAKKYNTNVVVIPTTIDTDYHKPKPPVNKQINKICIGWTGSRSTIKHFETALPVLIKLYQNYADKIYFKLINEISVEYPEIGLKSTIWNSTDEIEQLSELDIGLMPLPNDKWSKGKCGFKGLQYMALEIATIMSPVGVNTEIIEHGVNGLLASTEEEWYQQLEYLILNPEAREKLGKAGRQTIVDRYSKQSQKTHYLRYFNELNTA